MFLQGDALAAQAEMVGEQFFHRQALLRRMGTGRQRSDVGTCWWTVHGQHRVAQRGQFEIGQQCGR
ncbi:hypothetical protein D3C81_2067650 [compost metagenome]